MQINGRSSRFSPHFRLTSSSMSCKEMPSIRSLTPLWMRSPQRVHRTAVGMLARLGDAAGRRQRAFHCPQDRAYGDIFRLVRQRISALCSADGKHQPRLAQRRDELLEVGFGDALPLCDAF